MSQIIPLKSVPNQTATMLLASQLTKISLYTLIDGRLYADVLVNDQVIIQGVICQNANRLMRSAYLGFSGDLAFVDTKGSSDPTYDGLGARYQLWYLTAAEVAAGGYKT